MIKAVIIDDEQNNIDNLQILLQQYCPQVTVIASSLNADDGKKIILQYQPDLIFLDIQMPEKSGFDLLKLLPDYSFEIIFVTAYDQYGIQAVKFAAIDYLLKPIDINELQNAVQKAIKKCTAKQQNLQLQNLIQLLQQQNQKQLHRIALQSAKETRFVETDKIIRCESNNNYTTFFLVNNEKIIVSKPIYEYEELLKHYDFIRCHQSHLVNKKFIKSFVKEDVGYLVLDDKTHIPVSKQKKELVKKTLSL
jgi:Response regulator of the LytR/AlgR family